MQANEILKLIFFLEDLRKGKFSLSSASQLIDADAHTTNYHINCYASRYYIGYQEAGASLIFENFFVQLFCQIQAIVGLPAHQMRLVFASRQLEDEKLLCDYNIQKGKPDSF